MTTHAKQELKLSHRVVEEIISHARAEAPNECCGILAGQGVIVSHVYRARNAAKSPVKYDLDQTDYIAIQRKMDTSGLELVGFYHSHTRTEAVPSITDENAARQVGWFDQIFLIVSLRVWENPEIRAFQIREESVNELTVSVGG